jgi:hypothetical protein
VGRQYPMQALARLVDFRRKTFKANGGIHQVAQDRLTRTGVARKISVDRFRKERLAEPRVVLCAFQNCAPKISFECHFNSSCLCNLNRDLAFPPGTRRGSHDDLNIPTKPGQALHEFFFGNTPKLPAQQV